MSTCRKSVMSCVGILWSNRLGLKKHTNNQRRKKQVQYDSKFAFMTVNMVKYAALAILSAEELLLGSQKKGSNHQNSVIGTFFQALQATK